MIGFWEVIGQAECTLALSQDIIGESTRISLSCACYMLSTRNESNSSKDQSSYPEVPAGSILIPRWIVYLQAALLGTCAVTFFIFGVMVGTLNNPKVEVVSTSEFSVSGIASYSKSGVSLPDAGAVVMLLPETPAEVSRQSPDTVRPENFEPLENPVIDFVAQQGGTIVRTNSAGKFEIFAKSGSYFLLLISNSISERSSDKMSREQVAALSQYFLPVENLIRDNAYSWTKIQVNDEPMLLGDVKVN